MKLVFTLNQMDAFALSEQRFSEVYSLCRSYNGVPKGEFWSTYDCMDYFFNSDTFNVYEQEGSHTQCVSIRGQEFELEIVRHAFFVHHSMINLKFRLQEVKNGTASVSALRNQRKHLVELLDSVEW